MPGRGCGSCRCSASVGRRLNGASSVASTTQTLPDIGSFCGLARRARLAARVWARISIPCIRQKSSSGRSARTGSESPVSSSRNPGTLTRPGSARRRRASIVSRATWKLALRSSVGGSKPAATEAETWPAEVQTGFDPFFGHVLAGLLSGGDDCTPPNMVYVDEALPAVRSGSFCRLPYSSRKAGVWLGGHALQPRLPNAPVDTPKRRWTVRAASQGGDQVARYDARSKPPSYTNGPMY